MIAVNALVALLVVAASMWLALAPTEEAQQARGFRRHNVAESQVVVRDGEQGLVDATGHFVPLRPYQRIVSTSRIGDGMLLELCEPARVLRFSHYSAKDSPFRHRYAGKGLDFDVQDVERLLALSPDLVLVHNIRSAEDVIRLRDAGLTVFDFGEMRGLSTLLPNLRTMGILMGRPERGAELAERFERRLRHVAAGVPRDQWPGGLYVAVHGDKIYGGTDGTSYHDVLTAAGVRDVAAERYDRWPAYTAEQLLSLDPDVVVTSSGMRRTFCRHPGFERLRACRTDGGVVGVDGVLLSSSGLDMLEAAEAVFEQVHGERADYRGGSSPTSE